MGAPFTVGPSFEWEISIGTYSGLCFSGDGQYLYFVARSPCQIIRFQLAIPWDVSSKIGAASSGVLWTDSTLHPDVHIADNGTDVFVTNSPNDRIYHFTTPTPWDITALTLVDYKSIWTGAIYSPQCLTFKPDGTKFYVGYLTSYLAEYTLSTPFDLSTAVMSFSSRPADLNFPYGLSISGDGENLYHYSNDSVAGGKMTTPWDLSSYVPDSIVISRETIWESLTPDAGNPNINGLLIKAGLFCKADDSGLFLFGEYDYTDWGDYKAAILSFFGAVLPSPFWTDFNGQIETE
jgi:hypothetical protein